MSELANRAERQKLGQLLGLKETDLHFLEKIDERSIAALREQTSGMLFDRNRGMFQRIAASSKLLPNSLLAVIAERAIGPWLCAHVAGHMPTAAAIDLASRLPVPFLADTCVQLDPRRVQPLIRGIPVSQVKSVAKELVRRRDYITMGRFVDSLPESTIRQVLDDTPQDDALLLIAYYAENKEHLSHVIGFLSEERLMRVMQAAQDHSLWPEALGLMSYVSPALRTRLADMAAGQNDTLLTGMVEAIKQHNIWNDALPIVGFMSEPSRKRFINLPAVQDDAALTGIIAASRDLGLWPTLLPLIDLMDDAGRARVARIAEAQDDVIIHEFIQTAHAHDLWVAALNLFHHMQPERQAALALLLSRNDKTVLEGLIASVSRDNHWTRLIVIGERMPLDVQQQLIAHGMTLDPGIISRLIEAAEEVGAWDMALQALAASDASVRAQVPEVMQRLSAEQRGMIKHRADSLGFSALIP